MDRMGVSREAFVIGMGEVGRRIAGALSAAGWTVRPVTRKEGWPAAVAPSDLSPRIVAVREEQLADVLVRVPCELRPRLVLVQNGFLEAVHGDLGRVSRGLIWFTSKGDFFKGLCPSVFFGAHADDLVAALRASGIGAETAAGRPEFLREMIVKGIWNAVVGLPLAVHGVDLATYLSTFGEELEALAAESTAAAGAEYGVEVASAEVVRKIGETTTELGWVRGGAKALAWRNGAIARFGRRHDVPTPVNDRLLRVAGHDPDPD